MEVKEDQGNDLEGVIADGFVEWRDVACSWAQIQDRKMVLRTFLRTRPLFGTQRGARVAKLRDDRRGASCCEGSTSTGALYVFMLVSICDFLRCRQWTTVFLLCVRVRERGRKE